MSKRRPPGLAARGGRFWKQATDGYELEPTHVELLTQACRLMDRADALAAAVAADGVVVAGSTGQPRPHPALAEERQVSLALGRLLNQLGLGEADDKPESATTIKARKAAEARWGTVRSLDERRGS